jgi:hypothetical protein
MTSYRWPDEKTLAGGYQLNQISKHTNSNAEGIHCEWNDRNEIRLYHRQSVIVNGKLEESIDSGIDQAKSVACSRDKSGFKVRSGSIVHVGTVDQASVNCWRSDSFVIFELS